MGGSESGHEGGWVGKEDHAEEWCKKEIAYAIIIASNSRQLCLCLKHNISCLLNFQTLYNNGGRDTP